MSRLKFAHYSLLVLVVFDLLILLGTALPALIGWDIFASLIGSAYPDFYLRPLILINTGIIAWLLSPPVSRGYQKLIAGALFMAAIVETVQNLEFNSGVKIIFMALATAGYYLLYIVAFSLHAGKFNVKSLLPFAVVIFYTIIMFLALRIQEKNNGEFLLPSIFYLIVVTFMIGFSFQRVLKGDLSMSSLLGAGGAVILLVSDSFRAIAVFKFEGQFLLDEFLIMALFFTGQFAIAWSVRGEES